MGRPSKKEIEKRKEAKHKKILGYLIESIVGGVIFTLLLYIMLGDDTTINIIEYIQENNLAIRLMFAAFPISTIVIFGVDVAKGILNGDLDK